MRKPLEIPPELKPITPFVRRAEELDKDSGRPESRLVAYYCRQYAVLTGIPLCNNNTAKEAKTTCLKTLLEQLEQEKPAMDNFSRPEAEFLCRQFAYRVFDKADGEDRMGMANKTTAKTFYTSASFLQMLEQFYNDDSAVKNDNDQDDPKKEDKKRAFYAKWKATEILKAIKEGRTPHPGGYGEQDPADDDEGGVINGGDDGGLRNEESTGEHEEKKKDDAPSMTSTTGNPRKHEVAEDAPEDDDVRPSSVPQSAKVETVFKEEDDNQDEQGMEVSLGPPPSYPGSLPPPPAIPAPPLPPPPAQKPPPSKGWFGGGKAPNRGPNVSKAQLHDAMELTRFAMAALEDKDADLAAQRLRQALQALGK